MLIDAARYTPKKKNESSYSSKKNGNTGKKKKEPEVKKGSIANLIKLAEQYKGIK